MEKSNSKYDVKKSYCPKCGIENPSDARFCKSCGFFIGEGSDDDTFESAHPTIAPERPSTTEKEKDEQFPRCPRCGQNIAGQDRCSLCGLLTPQDEETQDDFLGDLMVGIPFLLKNPEKFADLLPYRRGLYSLIQPILWTALAFVIFWVTIYLSKGFKPVTLAGARISIGTFLLMSTAVLVLLIPCLIMLYILLVHFASILVGGRGIIERTARTLCVICVAVLLFTATLLSLYLVSVALKSKYELFLSDSPWKDYFMAVPLVLKFVMYAVWLYFLVIQIRVNARIHYFEPLRSIAAHILAAIPVGIYFFLIHYGYI